MGSMVSGGLRGCELHHPGLLHKVMTGVEVQIAPLSSRWNTSMIHSSDEMSSLTEWVHWQIFVPQIAMKLNRAVEKNCSDTLKLDQRAHNVAFTQCGMGWSSHPTPPTHSPPHTHPYINAQSISLEHWFTHVHENHSFTCAAGEGSLDLNVCLEGQQSWGQTYGNRK